MKQNQKLQNAVTEFENRQSRRVHPDGTFDKAGRWYPSDSESCGCCDEVRGPSRSYPYSYMVHCRTAKHIANLYGVDEKQIKKIARENRKTALAIAA